METENNEIDQNNAFLQFSHFKLKSLRFKIAYFLCIYIYIFQYILNNNLIKKS